MRHPHRLLARALALTTTVATVPLAVVLTGTPAIAAPRTPHFGSAIEADAPYQGQTICDPTAKPGVEKFRALVLATYPGTGDSGITRPCSVGGRSEHKEGRAWDWTVSVTDSHQVSQVNDLMSWLFATDQYGNQHAMARRLGIMYIIWNARIWHAGESHWDPYSCTGTTGCHKDHVHFSFDWAGALAKTSYWTGRVTTYIATPVGVLDDSVLPLSVSVRAQDATSVLTTFELSKGHRYRLTATGTFVYRYDEHGAPMPADAECTLHQSSDTWHRWTIWEGFPGHNQLDLYANGNPVWQPSASKNNGHGCATDHTYTQDITLSSTKRLPFVVSDTQRKDNSGTLTVTIARR